MSSDLLDEVTSINSIYDEDTLLSLSESPFLYTLTLPSLPSISLRLEFPPNYPDAPPSLLGTQSIGNDFPKGAGTQVVDLVRNTLAEIYTPGAAVIFDLIEESSQKLPQLGLQGQEDQPQSSFEDSNGQRNQDPSHSADDSDVLQSQSELLGPTPLWTLSEVITEKKSIFIARAAPVSSVQQAQSYLAHLLSTDKKVSKATHNITAWRILGDGGVQFQDCDDDGETAAGGRLLHLLELMGVWGCMVVVTRW